MTVNVIDVNERPVFPVSTPTALQVIELSSVGTLLGVFSAVDPDAADVRRLKYSLVGVKADATGMPVLAINSSSGQLAVLGGVDFEQYPTHTLSVVVTDTGSLPLTDSVVVRVTVVNRNEAPIVTPNQRFTASESWGQGRAVGVVRAVDPDANSTLTYNIVSGNIGAAFSIDTATGMLSVSWDGALDYENVVLYTVYISVRDSGVIGDEAPLEVIEPIVVEVLNANDVMLQRFEGVVVHPTLGGGIITLRGANFGRIIPLPSGSWGPDAVVSFGGPTGEQYPMRTVPDAASPSDPPAVLRMFECQRNGSTLIRCSVGSGSGKALQWRITVGSDTFLSAAPLVTAYATPTILNITGAEAMPTSGGATVTIRGHSFGPLDSVMTVYYGPVRSPMRYVAANCTLTALDAVIVCRSVPGVGGMLQWRVASSGNLGALYPLSPLWSTYVSSYAPPVIEIVHSTAPLLDTRGGQFVYLSGSNFGPTTEADNQLAVTFTHASPKPNSIRFDAVDCYVLTSHVNISCRTPPGFGRDHVWTVTVDGQTSFAPSNASDAAPPPVPVSQLQTSYSVPKVRSSEGAGSDGASTSGGQVVRLRGDFFGPSSIATPRLLVTYGPGPDATRYVAEGCTVFEDHVTVRCFTAVGTGKGHLWRVVIDDVSSIVETDVIMSYAPPTIIGYDGEGANAAFTRGGQIVRVQGKNFGVLNDTIDYVRYGLESAEYDAEQCYVSVDHNEITCLSAEGAGAGLLWNVQIDGQLSSVSTTNYAPPVIERFEGPAVSDANTDGGQQIFIIGRHFGPPSQPAYLESVTYGRGLAYSTKCTVVTHENISCLTVPGVGANMHWQVRVRGQASELSPVTTSYALPSIHMVFPNGSDPAGNEAKVEVPTAGDIDMQILARNLGHLARGTRLNMIFRGVVQSATLDPESEWQVVSRGEVMQTRRPSRPPVEVETYTSTEDGFRYRSTSTLVSSSASGDLVFVVLEREIYLLTWRLPSGEGQLQTMQLVVTELTGETYLSNVVTINYEIPQIDRVVTNQGARNTYVVLSLEGVFFGTQPTVMLYLGENDAEPYLSAHADGTVDYTLAGGRNYTSAMGVRFACGAVREHKFVDCAYFYGSNGLEGYVRMKDNTGRESNLVYFKNIAPQVCGFNTDAGGLMRTDGSTVVTVDGAFFGQRTTVTVDGFLCDNLDIEDSRFVCFDAAGVEEPCRPTSTRVRREFLFPAYPSLLCPADIAVDADSAPKAVKCLAPVSYGPSRSVVVYNGNQPSKSFLLSYQEPVITSVSVTSLRTSGFVGPSHDSVGDRTVMVIRGEHFSDWRTVDASCRNPLIMEPSRCNSSVVCEEVGQRGMRPECRARCRAASCVWSAVEPDTAARPMGTVSLRRDGIINFLKVRSWNQTEIVAEVPEGEGADYSLVVEVGLVLTDELEFGLVAPPLPVETMLQVTAATPVSYNRPIVNDVRITTEGPYFSTRRGPTRGGVVLEVTGDNFGVNTLKYGHINVNPGKVDAIYHGPTVHVCDRVLTLLCSPCVVLDFNHTSLTCTMPPGIGPDKFVRVTVDSQSNPRTEAGGFVGYSSPVIDSMSAYSANTGPASIQETPANITIFGRNFGSPNEVAAILQYTALPPVKVVVRGLDESDPNLRETVLLDHTHETLVFRVPPGEGIDNNVFVEAFGQSSNQVDFSYNPPNVTYVMDMAGDPLEFGSCCSTKGDFRIRLIGTSFGFRGLSRRVLFSTNRHRNLTFGDDSGSGVSEVPTDGNVYPLGWKRCVEDPTSFSRVGITQHNEIVCVVPSGVGFNLSFAVFVGSSRPQMSNLLPFSYDPPSIDYVTPFPPDANGQELTFIGSNLADEDGNIADGGPVIMIGGKPCILVVDDLTADRFTCKSSEDTVGPKNISLIVGGQVFFVSDNKTENDGKTNFFFEAYCQAGAITADGTGFYGSTGELCVQCPQGGVCTDKPFMEPVSVAGWWRMMEPTYTNGVKNRRCAEEIVDKRRTCPVMVPCEPKDSCLGKNLCSKKYTGERCALCAPKHYRRGGECIKCPNQAWMLIVIFFGMLMLLGLAGYFLHKKKMHFAFVSIGIDYFQVIAMFANSRVRWPPAITMLFRILSSFNLSLDITAPECSLPNMKYHMKWFFVEGMPLGIIGIMIVLHVFLFLWKYVVLGQRSQGRASSHLPTFVGIYLMVFYYMYLYLTTTSLDMFNCTPTTPPDGHTYLEVVFVPCYEKGGLHLMLLPYAIASFLTYSIGFPILLGCCLYYFRKLIQEDQVGARACCRCTLFLHLSLSSLCPYRSCESVHQCLCVRVRMLMVVWWALVYICSCCVLVVSVPPAWRTPTR